MSRDNLKTNDPEIRRLASEYHGGQWSKLYALSSSGHIDAGTVVELEREITYANEYDEPDTAREELTRLYEYAREFIASYPVTQKFGMVAGYYWNCDSALCEECAIGEEWLGFESWEEPMVIHENSESDSPIVCEECDSVLDSALTGEGVTYVVDYLRRYVRDYLIDASPRYHNRDEEELKRIRREVGFFYGRASSSTLADGYHSLIEYYGGLSVMEETTLSAYWHVRALERSLSV